ncbi:MAG: stage III sporulation protein AF [Lachnospiraceae bacterium]|nr:stage III sporulation protein AF [Lachnospiraceae bacterium]
MLSGLYSWMRQIIVFLLVTELLTRLTSEKYRKYLKLAVGLCLMFLVASPLLKKLSGLDFAQMFREAQLRTDFMPGKIEGEGAWRDGVLTEYETVVKKQLDEILAGLSLTVKKVQFWIEDSVIEGMSVWVEGTGEGMDGEEKTEMEKISITEIVIDLDREEGGKTDTDSVTEFVARMRIADFYDMDITHINVIKEE